MPKLRLLVGLCVAAMFIFGLGRLAWEPWGELIRQDDAPLERFLRDAARRIPEGAPIHLETDLFGHAYATRFHPRPILARPHPDAWVLQFVVDGFDPATSKIREPRGRR